MRFIAKETIPPKVIFTIDEYRCLFAFFVEKHIHPGRESFNVHHYEITVFMENESGGICNHHDRQYIFDMDMDEEIVWLKRKNQSGSTGYKLREIEKYFVEHGIRDGRQSPNTIINEKEYVIT